MTGWLGLTDDERRSSLTQAQIRSGILPKAIEKDWWVTLVLKALFELPFAKHFIFKGGTSLSKGWRKKVPSQKYRQTGRFMILL